MDFEIETALGGRKRQDIERVDFITAATIVAYQRAMSARTFVEPSDYAVSLYLFCIPIPLFPPKSQSYEDDADVFADKVISGVSQDDTRQGLLLNSLRSPVLEVSKDTFQGDSFRRYFSLDDDDVYEVFSWEPFTGGGQGMSGGRFRGL